MHYKKKVVLSLLFFLFPLIVYADTTIYITESYRDGGKFQDNDSSKSFSLHQSNATSLILTKAINLTQTVEFTYSFQNTELRSDNMKLFDVDISYFHLGGTKQISKNDNAEFYGLGGIGATYFSPDSDLSSETKFSLSLGLGGKYDLSERLVLRGDVKVFSTLIDSGSGIFCGGSTEGVGGCSVFVSGSAVNQFEAGIGLGYKF